MSETKQEIKIVKLTDFNFPPEVFIPLKSGKFVDNVISRKGGTMPATITVVVGEAGSGKTTYLVDKMCSIQEHNPEKECLYVSSEMNPIDNEELAQELPQLRNLKTLYLTDYEDPKLAMEEALDMGWDYVIVDSFMDTKDKVRDSDNCKMTSTAVETWLIGLLVKNMKGGNSKGKYTAFDMVQHITKGGTYAGSTKLKHNTTAMLFIRVDQQTNERYLVYTKNRRGDINKKLYITLGDSGLEFNSRKYNELEKALKIQKDMDTFQAKNDDELMELLSNPEFNVDGEKVVTKVVDIDISDIDDDYESDNNPEDVEFVEITT